MAPDLNDGFAYSDEFINYMLNKAGKSNKANGIRGWNLVNEPGIWHQTHPCVHPLRATCNEILTKNIETAKRIKTLDAGAETFGPGAYGYAEYMQLVPITAPTDWGTYNMSDVPGYNGVNYNHLTWLASYLRRMRMASEAEGKRLLDVLDIHYYREWNANINWFQDSRSFWDETYVENSWITTDVLGNKPVNLANNVQNVIKDFYPGTKFAVTEWGHFGDAPGLEYGIYIADMLGAFGSKDVYLATY